MELNKKLELLKVKPLSTYTVNIFGLLKGKFKVLVLVI